MNPLKILKHNYIWVNLPGTVLALLLLKVLPATALSTYSANDFSSLQTAINDANGNGGGTIDINANITLTSLLPEINSNITFVGDNFTINGANTYEDFFVNSGTVSFSNLTITDGKATGGNGGNGYGYLRSSPS